MRKFWICLLLLAVGTASGQDDDFASSDYDYYAYADLMEQDGMGKDDYQIEDNRAGLPETELKANDDEAQKITQKAQYSEEGNEDNSEESKNLPLNKGDDDGESNEQASKEQNEEANMDSDELNILLSSEDDKILADVHSILTQKLNDEIDNKETVNIDDVQMVEEKREKPDEIDQKDDQSEEALGEEKDDTMSQENQNNNNNDNENDESIAQSDELVLENDNSEDKSSLDTKNIDDMTEKTQVILKDQEGNDFDSEKVINENSAEDDVVDETKLLEDAVSNFDDADNENDNNEKSKEDTVDAVYADLNEDLIQLQEIIKKIESQHLYEKNPDDSFDPSSDFDDYADKSEDIENNKESDIVENVADNGTFDENVDEMSNLDNVSDEDQVNNKNNKVHSSLEADQVDDNMNTDEEDNEDDTNDEEFSDSEFSIDKIAADIVSAEESKNRDDDTANLFNIQPTDTKKEAEAFKENVNVDEIKDNDDKKSTVSSLDDFYKNRVWWPGELPSGIESEEKTTQTPAIDVGDLTSEQYNQIMAQFKVAHKDELDISKNEMDRNVAPVHITLSLDEPTVVTSPNYPSPYPTNNIVDWIFTGDGVGIELNITDFFVNGVIGDYVLFIPGGLDATRTDGLLFSYRLNQPRRYRFFDVNQMFVRFESRPGMPFTRGFSFSAKMIMERVDVIEENALPEIEAPIPKPTQTLTLYIGGQSLTEFREKQEEFRQIIADMATLYINSNGINQGLNATIETTMITRTAPCNVQWPDYIYCAEVTFGVPLVYEDQPEDEEPRLTKGELRAMWYLYSGEDPFASRLTRAGMSEFQIPDDSTVLTAWVVIGVGVVIAMALIAVALWRFSCFENYTRMPQHSDRDSIYSEKQGLDLYPTPHQTLPPLYGDNEYKWDDLKYDEATRVDMGGITNKSYVGDMYGIESDEDVIKPRDRDASVTPKDKYAV